MIRVAAVPVRSLRDAKTRLAVENRSGLAAHMLGHVLRTLMASDVFETVAVVSPDADVLAMAAEWGASAVLQRGHGLNPACEQAAEWAVERGADALLIAHADLPAVTPADIRAMVALGERASVVIAPDRHGTGTNLLLASPPHALHFAFGPDSRARHREAAGALSVLEFISAGTSADVDTASDLAESAIDAPARRSASEVCHK